MTRTLMILTVALLLVAGCEGPVGPQGEQGTTGTTGQQGDQGTTGTTGQQGDQGATGEQGEQGESGPEGSFSYETETITLRTADFSDSGIVETAAYVISAITADVAVNGLVLAYTDLGGGRGDAWFALPVVFPVASGTVSQSYAYTTGGVVIQLLRSGGLAVASVFDGHQIRVFIIPPSGTAKLRDVNLEDYHAVTSRLEFER